MIAGHRPFHDPVALACKRRDSKCDLRRQGGGRRALLDAEPGIPAFDNVGLPPADRRALGKIIEAHPQVRRIVAGHMHRTMSAELGGRNVLAVPSTYVQARLDFGAEEIQLSAEPSGFAVHAFVDGELVSHVQPVQ